MLPTTAMMIQDRIPMLHTATANVPPWMRCRFSCKDSGMARLYQMRVKADTPGRARTCDPPLRRRMLYSTELRARGGGKQKSGKRESNSH